MPVGNTARNMSKTKKNVEENKKAVNPAEMVLDCRIASVVIILTTAAPTIGLSKVITFSNDQEKVNITTKENIKQVSDSTQKILIQNNWFKSYVTDTLEKQQADIDFLKSNCVCKSRSYQCFSSESQ